MESANQLNHADRRTQLMQWLQNTCAISSFSMISMPHDASFRRYFRIVTPSTTYVLMDAPPDKENCAPFVAIAKQIRHLGLMAPEIFASDLQQGFLLLSDFGHHTYLQSLTTKNADELYGNALQALGTLQGIRNVPEHTLPFFDAKLMWQEWVLHQEWFLEKFLKLNLDPQTKTTLDECMHQIIAAAIEQPQVFMHRDFHSANLMVLANNQCGILDFQDAFMGPVTYDLVSLLRDCYIDWPPEKVHAWVKQYWQQLIAMHTLNNVSETQFLKWFDWMGIQRHLKALLTFARKAVRDQHPQYLQYVPRTMNYLITVSAQYPELKPLHLFLSQTVLPTFKMRTTSCAE